MARKRKRSRSRSATSPGAGGVAVAGGGARGVAVAGVGDVAGVGAGGVAGGGGGRISEMSPGALAFVSEKYRVACENNNERMKEQLTDTIDYLSNTHCPLDKRISLLIFPLLGARVLTSSFVDQMISRKGREGEEGKYRFLRQSIGPFLYEGHCLIIDMCSCLDRWDPDLKAVAKAASAFGSLARLICWDEMVELCNKMEAASLEGNSPIEICGPFWKARGLFRKFGLKLYFLLVLVQSGYAYFLLIVCQANKGLGTRPPSWPPKPRPGAPAPASDPSLPGA